MAKHPNAHAHTFLRRVRTLPRARAALLFQLTTGHVALQAHLCRLRVVESNVCPHCGEAPETVAHYLLRCRTFTAERHLHLTARGLEYLNLSFLFSFPDALAPLFAYIKATGRFSGLNL
ncbi:hypothetical protein BDV93DRAFT_455060 [Ceratobasidium sp. AG-I]|nr:hypothetical protein BDV93DRAFT_455060 [Ceratobasidium sp. AG-I]